MKWSEYAAQLSERGIEACKPTMAVFELTPLCNFNCNMCFIHLTPEQARAQGEALSTEEWLRIARDAKRLGVFCIEVTGGEAVTRPDFPILYEAFIKMGYLITLRSNGYLLRGETLKLLKKYKPRSLSITLYGGSDETYKKVCGVADGFSVVTENIQRLRAEGIEPLLTVTMTKDNYSDRGRLEKWAETQSTHISFFGGLVTPIRGAKRSISHLKIDYGADRIRICEEIPDRVIENRERYMKPFWMCRHFGTEFCISWDGRMTLCNCLPAIWTDALTQNLDEAFKTLYNQLNAVNRPEKCRDCRLIDYCGSCPARFYSETGDVEKTSDELCRIAKIGYSLSVLNRQSSSSDEDRERSLDIRENELNEG